MLVILVVTTHATAGQFHFFEHGGFVASGALDIFMFALQLETRFVMIEIPALPIPGVVASLAIRSHGTLMRFLVLFLVT